MVALPPPPQAPFLNMRPPSSHFDPRPQYVPSIPKPVPIVALPPVVPLPPVRSLPVDSHAAYKEAKANLTKFANLFSSAPKAPPTDKQPKKEKSSSHTSAFQSRDRREDQKQRKSSQPSLARPEADFMRTIYKKASVMKDARERRVSEARKRGDLA